ncbi:hypothetical protein SAMN05660464_4466 [Geodermatophilus dictyosporus]|uniref:Phage integrase family protein n=1 Tax=Geodermatophilus dictyosporus TaxID=1523247 RepID=A0A1I5TR62_9ACTN|nr:hypothetical protein SAMN05660464_4466 [Geodermatophilus dictyosporus]
MFSVSRWLGHSSIAFTDAVYAHVAQEPDYTAAIKRTRRARGLQGHRLRLSQVRTGW